MEQALKSVEFAVLNRVHTQVNICKQWQVFNVFQLIDFLNVVHTHVKELEALDRLKASKSVNLVLGEVQCSQNYKCFQVLNYSNVVGTEVQLFDPHVV